MHKVYWSWAWVEVWKSISIRKVPDADAERSRYCSRKLPSAAFQRAQVSAARWAERHWLGRNQRATTLGGFKLRHRHLHDGDLSDDEKKRIAKKVPAVNESSEYHRALFLLTLCMCRLDRDKASAILYCFARLSESNIRRRVNKLCITIGDF